MKNYRKIYVSVMVLVLWTLVTYVLFGHRWIELVYERVFPIQYFDQFVKNTRSLESNIVRFDGWVMGYAVIALFLLGSHYVITRARDGFDTVFTKYFRQPVGAQSLNLFRFLFCGMLCFRMWEQTGVLNEGPYNPLPILEFFGIPLISSGTFFFLHYVLLAALACSAIGFLTRLSLIASLMSFIIYQATYLGFSKSAFSNYVPHTTNIIVVVLFILIFTPAVGAYGIDGLIRRRGRWGIDDPARRVVPNWAGQLIILTLAAAYFGAGYCKVVTNPLWADGYTIQAYILEKYLLHDNGPAYWVAQKFWLCVIASISTLILECGFFYILVWPRWRWAFVLSGLALHIGILVTMKISFLGIFCLVYLVFISWPLVLKIGRHTVGRCFQEVRSKLDERLTEQEEASKMSLDPPERTAGPIERIVQSRTFSKIFVSAVALLLFGSVFFRIESWPLTDYRVYQDRQHFSTLQVYRIQGRTRQGDLQWLSGEYLKRSPTIINTHLRHSTGAIDQDGMRALVQAFLIDDRAQIKRAFANVSLVRRTVIMDQHRQIQIIDHTVMDLLK